MKNRARSARRARSVLVLLGLLLALGSLFAYELGISASRGFSPGKAILLAFAAILLSVGILGHRAPRLYVSACVLLVNSLVLLALVEVGWLVLARLRDFLPRPETPLPRAERTQYIDRGREDLPYFQQQDWAKTYWREYREAWDERPREYRPYVIWRSDPFTGRTLNIDADGRRLTPGAECGPDSLTVFAVGGSTMWGTGVPDWGTIPAFIQTELSEKLDRPVCVLNLSEQAWVSTQEIIHLILELGGGHIPDAIIFYDGINDVYGAYQSGLPGAPQNLSTIEARFEQRPETSPIMQLAMKLKSFRMLRKLVAADDDDRIRGTHQPFEVESLAEAVARVYMGNIETAKALADHHGFAVHFFWQPLLLIDKKPLTAEESAIKGLASGVYPGLVELYSATYQKMRGAAEEQSDLHDLVDIFAGETELVYIDPWHVTMEANQRLAREMIQQMAPVWKDAS